MHLLSCDSRFVLVIENYCVTSATTIVRRCYLNDLLLPWRIVHGIQSDKNVNTLTA